MLAPTAASACMPSLQSVRSSSESSGGPSRVLDHDGEVVEGRQLLRHAQELVGMGHQLRRRGSGPATRAPSRVGDGDAEAAHGADPAEAGRRHLPVDERDGLHGGVSRWEPTDDGVRAGRLVALASSSKVSSTELTRGGGDVDDLLDVPLCGFRPVGVDVEAPVHPRAGGIPGAGATGRGTSRSVPGPRDARGRRRRD